MTNLFHKNIIFLFSLLFIVLITGCSKKANNQVNELILCGQQEVSILQFSNTIDTTFTKVWSWTEQDAEGLPDSLAQFLFATDECKSVNHGKQILITASWRGGVALVDRKSKKVMFYAQIPNAHSAELLPNNRVVVAGSTAKNGNCLNIYDLNKSNHIIYKDSLYSGHGVIWDEKREITYKIPGISGHDLQRVPNSPDLSITENENVWIFDRDKRTFTEFETLAGSEHVKSVMINPVTNQLVYIHADSGKAHTEYIRFENPQKEIHFPGESFYKARWVTDSEPPTSQLFLKGL